MFNNLFDFGRRRSLKESIGFYIFYTAVFGSVTGILSLLGA